VDVGFEYGILWVMEPGFVQTQRLDLRPLPLPAYHLIAEGRQTDAEELLGISLDGFRVADLLRLVRYRLEQLKTDPTQLPWLIHLMILRERPTVVGDIGFHGPPDENGIVEIGYTVCEGFRRQGFATEAATGLARWVGTQPGVRGLRASISPTNAPSLALAARLGLVEVGSQMDEIRGKELVFEGPVP
jgi:ribosomal-protein-alanine N-acetyltransferase